MDSDGDLFTVEERVLLSYEPGNAITHVASYIIVCSN